MYLFSMGVVLVCTKQWLMLLLNDKELIFQSAISHSILQSEISEKNRLYRNDK